MCKGEQHYRTMKAFHKLDSVDNLQKRDKQKSEVCKELGKKKHSKYTHINIAKELR